MSEMAVLIFSAGIACAGLIVLSRPLLVRYALARPNARSSHARPTPQGGGIAVIASTLLVVFIHSLNVPPLGAAASLGPLLTGLLLLAFVGAVDDVVSIGVLPRLTAQLLAVALVTGMLPDDLRVVPVVPLWLERAAEAFGLLWFVNVVNFMDGIDWMTVAEIVPITGGIVLLGLLGALPPVAIVFALALLGAMLGFAPFNKPVARLFLGDAGSLPIGLLIGWLLLLLAGHGHLAAALLLPLYYLADSTITLLRRLANGERVWQAHRSHFYQRATDNGFSVREIVGRVFVVNLVLVAMASASAAIASAAMDILLLGAGGVVVGWLLLSFSRSRS